MKICEIFYSIQGEGLLIGLPTVFIRTSGCNLKCSWCDTKYAHEEGEERTLEDIMKEVKKHPTRHVCITGGEPLLQKDVQKLVGKLIDEGYMICFETNGSKSIEELPCEDSVLISLDVKCPSSGAHEKMDLTNIELLGPTDQLKFIVNDRVDYNYVKKIIEQYKPICSIIIIPVDGKDLKNLAKWVLKDGLNVRVLPQLHKFIWGEKRGV
jgi:7-carboxy-7-deazaguanine synthase